MENTKKPIHKRWFMWVAVVAVVIIAITNKSGADEPEAKEAAVAAQTNPPVELTLQERAESAIIKATGKSTNNKRDRIVDVSVINGIAIAKLNANENLSVSMTKGGILRDSAKVFEPLFSLTEIKEVALSWRLPLVDQYGNSSDADVLRMTLDRETAAKINWDGFDRDNFATIADQYWEHPAIQK